jgi:hypothetical protein
MTLTTLLSYAIPLALALWGLRAWNRWASRPQGRRYFYLYTEAYHRKEPSCSQ